MRNPVAITLLSACLAVGSGYAWATTHPNQSKHKQVRQDPAYRAGFDDGYREGGKDASGQSNAYKDQASPLYQDASDGYTPKYGDRESYQKLFRDGYRAGYKQGWDFYAGQTCPLGCGGGGP